jgi:hypothetical protein
MHRWVLQKSLGGFVASAGGQSFSFVTPDSVGQVKPGVVFGAGGGL